MPVINARQRRRVKGWALVIAWSILWTTTALAPFCEAWAADAAAGAASGVAAALQPASDLAPVPGEQTHCADLLSVPAPDSKPDFAAISAAVKSPPVARAAALPVAPALKAFGFRSKPARPSYGQVYLNTLRLRI